MPENEILKSCYWLLIKLERAWLIKLYKIARGLDIIMKDKTVFTKLLNLNYYLIYPYRIQLIYKTFSDVPGETY